MHTRRSDQFDERNPSHKMLMNVLGGMSESERQHVQARVRAAIDAQVLNEGRHQGSPSMRMSSTL
ncbi:recombinase family protein [Saccharopolyspora dendranthemae]|uniref:recombinase family protein n=1 Tax=Saccharopolyspora dendranthemae TaxID=1181886 RepID=UPI001FE4B9C6|nr:recombinase family protein [Saccharopolyspora dendranthemae]